MKPNFNLFEFDFEKTMHLKKNLWLNIYMIFRFRLKKSYKCSGNIFIHIQIVKMKVRYISSDWSRDNNEFRFLHKSLHQFSSCACGGHPLHREP